MMRQADREFSWSDPSERVLRRIRAADGSPGVRTTLCGLAVSVFDAHSDGRRPVSRARSLPGGTGRCSFAPATERSGWATPAVSPEPVNAACKLPAVTVLGRKLGDVPESLVARSMTRAGLRPPGDHLPPRR